MRLIITFLLLTLGQIPSFSQDIYPLSPTNGPYGGLPLCMVMKNNTLFVGTDCGVMCSDNDGTTWEIRSEGIPNCTEIKSIVEHNGRLICCTSNNGIFISDNDGLTWESSNLGLNSLVTYNLFVTGMDILLSSQEGIFKSSNSGSSWSFSGIGIPSNIGEHNFTTLGSLIFVANGTYGVFKSGDGGFSWSSTNTGLPSSGIGSIVAAGSSLLVTTNQGLYTSTNNGLSWTQTISNLPVVCWNIYNSGNAIYCNGSDGFGLYNNAFTGGLYRSDNNGASWTQITTIKASSLVFNGSKLYVASQFISSSCQYYINTGVYLATANETNWKNIGLGKANNINDMLKDGPNIFACTDNGMYYSNNQGETWSLINNGLPLNVSITCIAKLGGQLFIGTDKNGIYFSSDYGINWSPSNVGLTLPYLASSTLNFYSISAIESIGSDLYIGASGWTFCAAPSAPPGKIFKSINQGATWIDISNGINDGDEFVYLSDIISVGPAILVSDNSSSTGSSLGDIFLTTNGGTSWIPSAAGIPLGGVSQLAYDGTFIYATGTQNDNSGNSWGEVYYSTNYGTSWTSMNLPDYDNYVSLLCDGSTLFIGNTGGASVLITNNQGESLDYFQHIDGYITKLVGNSSELYVGTKETGSWSQPVGVYKNSGPLSLTRFPDDIKVNFFPNPFNDEIFVLGDYGLSNCQYTIHELSGAVLAEGAIKDGRITNLRHLSVGVYIVKLSCGENWIIEKLIKQ